jgi:hypothetical protein
MYVKVICIAYVQMDMEWHTLEVNVSLMNMVV